MVDREAAGDEIEGVVDVGQSGGVEPLMLGILVASGVGAALAAAAIICYRAVSLGLQVGAGAVAVSLTSPGLPSLASSR